MVEYHIIPRSFRAFHQMCYSFQQKTAANRICQKAAATNKANMTPCAKASATDTNPHEASTLVNHPCKSISIIPSRPAFLFQTFQIALDGLFQPEVQSVTNQCVTDAYFINPSYLFMHIFQVLQAQVMAGVQPQPQTASRSGRFHKRPDSRLRTSCISRSVRLRIKFHPVCPALPHIPPSPLRH